jgi:hypothetical protein
MKERNAYEVLAKAGPALKPESLWAFVHSVCMAINFDEVLNSAVNNYQEEANNNGYA